MQSNYSQFLSEFPMLTLNRHEIFPTPIWHLEDTPQDIIDVLKQGAYEAKEKHSNAQRSNQGGYQSPCYEWEDFPVKEYFNRLLVSIPFSNKSKVQIKGINAPSWWYNINSKGAWNIVHTHPDTSLALILYLTDTNHELSILNPHHHTRHFLHDFYHYISPTTKKGDILIFPADLMHFVKPNESERDRICVSMNLLLC